MPNATGAVAVFPTGGVNVSIPSATVTTGTIKTTNASGNVVIGDTATTTDILKLDVASGSPTIDVGSGGQLYMYANVTGSQGFTKTGGGLLVFRYNNDNMAYTGTVAMNAGIIIANQDGSLGDTSNPIVVTGNSTLQLQSGPSAGVTLNANRTTTINSGVTWTLANGVAAAASVASQVIGGSGNLNISTGTFTLNGVNTYAGNTTLTNVMRLTLGSGAKLSTAGLTLTNGTSQTFGTTVDLGGNSQSVSSLAITTATNRYTTTFTNGSLSVTGGNLGFNSGVASAASGTQTHSLDGLSSFTYSNAAGTFSASVSATTTGQVNQTVLNLANAGGSGTNTITASAVDIGNSAANTANQSTSVGLGKVNTFNTGSLKIGYYQGSGTVAFQPGVTNGSLTLRGTAGGSNPVDAMYVGYSNSGNGQLLRGTLDLTNGSLDAVVTSFNVGYSLVDNANFTASVTMPAGTLNAGTLALGSGTARSTATFTQSGGTVTAGALLFGGTAASGTPAYVLTYNLDGGTLRSGTISTNSGTFGTSTRKIAWTSGTIANFNASTDLTVNGTSAGGTNGLLTIDLGGLGSKVLAPDAGRTITFGANVVISNTGALTINGASTGSVVLNGSNSFSGGVNLNAGTLTLGNTGALGTSGTISFGGGTMKFSASNTTDYSGRFSTAAGQQYRIDTGNANVSLASSLISSGGSLTKVGSGTLTLGGANAYGGTTLIDAGTLKLGPSGSLASSLIKVSALAIYDLTNLTGYALGSGQTLAGVGTVLGDVTVAGGATLSPGNSPGTLLQTGNETWGGGGNYNWQLYDSGSTAIAGTGWDFLDVTGALSITATGSNPFNVNLWTLSGINPDVNGIANNFNGSFDYAWDFARFSGGISGFSPTAFNVVSSATNGTGGFLNVDATGQFSVRLKPGDSNTLQIYYASVPEPAGIALAGIGVGFAAWLVRRRRSRKAG